MSQYRLAQLLKFKLFDKKILFDALFSSQISLLLIVQF